MPIFESYSESVHKFENLSALKTAFAQLQESEQDFCNTVRRLYGIAALSSQIPESGSHVFCGGHVVLYDGAAWYNHWRDRLSTGALSGGARKSSHYSSVKAQQYEVRLKGLGCILFGLTSDTDTDARTWFQNESHGMTGSVSDKIMHIGYGYGKHKLSGNKQVGALGLSDFSEKTGKNLTVGRDLIELPGEA